MKAIEIQLTAPQLADVNADRCLDTLVAHENASRLPIPFHQTRGERIRQLPDRRAGDQGEHEGGQHDRRAGAGGGRQQHGKSGRSADGGEAGDASGTADRGKQDEPCRERPEYGSREIRRIENTDATT